MCTLVISDKSQSVGAISWYIQWSNAIVWEMA
jgi:hypothetical protein